MPSILVREVNKAAEQRHKKEELQKVTDEILAYRAQESKAIFEIGKRLKHVKENDLVHGEWLNWLETIDIKPRTAQRYIKVYERLGNTPTLSHLSPSKLFELLSLPKDVKPEEFVKKEHFIKSNNRTKTVEEMTVREVKEVVKKHKNQVKGRKAARNKQDRHRASNVVEFPNNQGQVGQQKEQQPPQQQAHEKEQPEIIKPFLNLTGEVIKLFERGVIDANIAWVVGALSEQDQLNFNEIVTTFGYEFGASDKKLIALFFKVGFNADEVKLIIEVKKQANDFPRGIELFGHAAKEEEERKIINFINYYFTLNKIIEEVYKGEICQKDDLIYVVKELQKLLPEIDAMIGKFIQRYQSNNFDNSYKKKTRDSFINTVNQGIDNYTLLGINQDASPEEIKQRYRHLAKLLHPDSGGDAALFQLVREAYEQLKV